MSWFNYYGLIIMAIIMIPNIVYAVKQKDGMALESHNKIRVICYFKLQYGRYFNREEKKYIYKRTKTVCGNNFFPK